MVSNHFQRPLFPRQETEVVVSAQAHLRHVCWVWREARTALTQTTTRNQHMADCHWAPAPNNQVDQKVWLLSHDLPSPTFLVPNTNNSAITKSLFYVFSFQKSMAVKTHFVQCGWACPLFSLLLSSRYDVRSLATTKKVWILTVCQLSGIPSCSD